MKKIIIASAFAIAASLSFAPAQADGLTIKLGDSHDHHYRDHDRDHRHHRPDRVVVRDHGRNHCVTKKVITHHNGKRVVRETKVCD